MVKDEPRYVLLPVTALVAAMLPITLGAVSLIFGSPAIGAPGVSGCQILAQAFRMCCAVFGPLAVLLALSGIIKGSIEGRRGFMAWLALGLAVGETVPIWWIPVQLAFTVLVVVVGFFVRLL